MSIEMKIFYDVINSVVTVLYYLLQILLLSDIVDHKKQIGKTILVYCAGYLIATVMSEAAVPVPIKTAVTVSGFIILYRLLLTRKTALVALYITYFSFFCLTMQEIIIIFVCKLNHINPWVDIGHGGELGKARVVLVSILITFVLTLVLKRFLKSTVGVVNETSTWFLVVATYMLHYLDNTLGQLFVQYVEGSFLLVGIILVVGIAAVSIILHFFFIHALSLEQIQREERFRMEALEKQFTYYQEKQKDEEQVRSVYHDMKNHLLVLEHQIHSPETAEMVEKLQRKVESYADYAHTGNDFLDVIIRDKARVAREKKIDFSVSADLYGMDFMEPLDISTIFGNGIDNAIEASEKLPEGQRVILVKVGRVQNFLSVLMENNCREESGQNRKRTSKKDGKFHGFGISNMKNAAGKYGGQLITTCEDGKFTLKIVIPVS